MRKISKLAARAFIEGRSFRRDNTEVNVRATILGKRKELRLHGNVIARQVAVDTANIGDYDIRPHYTSHCLHITLAGWGTPTTRERLHTLLKEMGKDEGVWQHKFDQYYGTDIHNRVISETEWITVT